jgi:cytochrome c oxidase assembly protein subunit 11
MTPDPAKNNRIALIVFTTVAVMIGLSFLSVPLYSLFCQATGLGGTTQTAKAYPDKILDRTITVKFNADRAPNMPWEFAPEQRQVDVKLGQKGVASFSAFNKAKVPVTGTAIYNVTPDKAGRYFHKVQCFCFQEQTLKPGEKVSMPVLFFVDPSLADDPNMNDVTTITLSYTFFKAQSQDLDKALEGFYNR